MGQSEINSLWQEKQRIHKCYENNFERLLKVLEKKWADVIEIEHCLRVERFYQNKSVQILIKLGIS